MLVEFENSDKNRPLVANFAAVWIAKFCLGKNRDFIILRK